MRLVSIVVPLYRSEKYVDKLVNSIIKQTYQDIEVILVDDGSPDKSGEIADKYKRQDARVKVIHKENGGTCDARNAGLAAAAGDYLMFADGDDWLELDCVDYLVRILEENDADMSMTDSIFTTRDRCQNKDDNVRIWDNSEAVAGIINTFYIPVGPWNKLYSKRLVEDNKLSFSVPWFGEGLYFSTMAAMFSSRVAVGHRKIYNYRLNNPNSGCTKREVINAKNSLNNILYIADCLTVNSRDITDALNWHIWSNYFNLICCIQGAGAVGEYKDEYEEAKRKLLEYMPGAIRHKLLSAKAKCKIMIKTYFPALMAKYINRSFEKEFRKDTME